MKDIRHFKELLGKDGKLNQAKLRGMSDMQLYNLVQELRTFATDLGIARSSVPPNPVDFAVKFSKGQWEKAPHLLYLGDWLTELEGGKRNRLLVSTPPRHGKSEAISVWFPIWLLARNPKRKIILVSYEFEFAAHWGRRVRDWIRDNGSELNLVLDSSSTAAHRWNLTAGGGMMTAGAGGPITGKGADFLIIDDPIKNEEEAASDVMREKLWSWFQTVALTRLEPGGKTVILGTRWHEDDLIGRLERDSKSGEGLAWDIIKFPAIAEADDQLGRQEGEALWNDRFPIEKLEEIRKGQSPYHFSCLYQQRPTPEEGNAVKRTWWQFYDALPDDLDVYVQSWDLAFKDMKKNDKCVGQVWARRGASVYLIDQIADHMNARDVIAAIKQFQKQYPRALAKLVEDKASGPAVIQILQKEVQGMIPVKAKGSKDMRLQGVIPLIQAGNVYLPRNKSWVWELVEQAAAFPNAPNDDMVDAMVYALLYLQPQGWVHMAREGREAAREAERPKDYIEAFNKDFFKNLHKTTKKAEKSHNKLYTRRTVLW